MDDSGSQLNGHDLDGKDAPGHPLPNWVIFVGATVIVISAVALTWVLLGNFGAGRPSDSAKLDVIRAVLPIVVSLGGLAGLILAARRQRSAEIDSLQRERVLQHQKETDAKAEEDAKQRRITELYTKASELMGSGQAPVRLSGIYALERLAQSSPEQRQTVINVLCAYLRMPYELPREGVSPTEIEAELPDKNEYLKQERIVRLAVQKMIADHLVPIGADGEAVSIFWPEIDLDLSGATLIGFDMRNAVVRRALFMESEFLGGAYFSHTRFLTADFRRSTFEREANFAFVVCVNNINMYNVTIGGNGIFSACHFAGSADLDGMSVGGALNFERAWLRNVSMLSLRVELDASFNSIRVDRDASFVDASITNACTFIKATFGGDVNFGRASFRRAIFVNAKFYEGATFSGSRADMWSMNCWVKVSDEYDESTWPVNFILRQPENIKDAPDGEDGWLRLVRNDAPD